MPRRWSILDEVVAAGQAAQRGDEGNRRAGYSTQAYPFRNLHDPLHRLFDAFGRTASSGAPTSPACPAATASA
jgi:hypothetical protein